MVVNNGGPGCPGIGRVFQLVVATGLTSAPLNIHGFTTRNGFTLLAPLGGETVSGCESLNIQWCAGATSGDYKLEYSDDAGATWNTIVNNHTLSGTQLNYNWTMPNLNSNQLRVRVSDAQFLARNDESGDMTITNSQYLDLTIKRWRAIDFRSGVPHRLPDLGAGFECASALLDKQR